MKKALALLIYCLLSALLYGQMQTGLVREINSGKKPVGGVQVTFDGAVPTVSDDNGNFRLAFSGKKPGDFVTLNEINKAGYELVNGKELEIIKLSSTGRLGEDIIVAKKGVIDAAKKEYYKVSDRALLVSFNKEKKALRSKLQRAQLGKKEYEHLYTALNQQYQQQRKQLDEYAAKFARVNFDDVDSLYRSALKLFKEGKIQKCKHLLERANLLDRVEKRLLVRKKIEAAKQEMEAQEMENEYGIKNDIPVIQLQASAYALNFEMRKAEVLYDKLLQLDSNDLNVLQSAANFYRYEQKHRKALNLYQVIILHNKVEPWQKANSHGYIGDIHLSIGDFQRATSSYSSLVTFYENLLLNDSTSLTYKNNLATAYFKMGVVYVATGKLKKALEYFYSAHSISLKLYAEYPNNLFYVNRLAVDCSRIGATHLDLGDITNAMTFFERYNVYSEKLYLKDSTNVEYASNLAASYSKLASLFKIQQNKQMSFKYYSLDYQLSELLSENNPNDYILSNGLAISSLNLGYANMDLGDTAKGYKLISRAIQILENLYIIYPDNIEFLNSLALAYSYLGELYKLQRNQQKVFFYFEKYHDLSKKTHDIHSDDLTSIYHESIASTKIGDSYFSMGDTSKAFFYFKKAYRNASYLFNVCTDNVEYVDLLAVANGKIGSYYNDMDSVQMAISHFNKGISLMDTLFMQFPFRLDYMKKAALFNKVLAFLYMKRGKLIESLPYLEKTFSLEVKYYSQNLHDSEHFDKLYQTYKYAIAVCQHTKKYAAALNFSLQFIDLSQKTLANIQTTVDLKKVIATANGGSSFYSLFLQQFSQAEQYALSGLATDSTQTWIYANLALAYLYQDKWEQAKKIYMSLKDQRNGSQPFKTAFLQDLKDLEAAGITHPDVAKARVLLEQ